MKEHSFVLKSQYSPSGDQPKAIEEICAGLASGEKSQMLLGITGSGKTFTMANIIARTGRPSLIMAHNKTLAAQLYSEMRSLFPENAVEYFVSYYDYYQPEAYIPRTDTFIEKDSSINDQIDLLRHSATRSLLERRDVIVVSSVSCIYGLGSPELYYQMTLELECGKEYKRDYVLKELVNLQYQRNDISFERGCFRVSGEVIDIFPSHYSSRAWRLSFFGDELEEMNEFDPLTGKNFRSLTKTVIYANSHFVTPESVIKRAIIGIQDELEKRLRYLKDNGFELEAQRLNQRTSYDIEMLEATGSCKGIENYSRFLTGTESGKPPPTLFEYLPKDALLFVDESHVMLPQLRAMYNGDRARKSALVEYGFRLPSALDNRPLKFEEWQEYRPQTIFVSATPGEFELDEVQGVVTELIIRPTGLLDPECIIRPARGQVDDLIGEIKQVTANGQRVLVTTLTKKMSEDLSDYLATLGFKVSYLHSVIKTLERIEIINDLREGKIEVLIGVNLLREGLDIPECSLVAILDADKEGFLRSETSLIQTIGRAARNAQGRVILYADYLTGSIDKAIKETERRRDIQRSYNQKHGIIPKTTTANKTGFDDFILNPGNVPNGYTSIPGELGAIRKKQYDLVDQGLTAMREIVNDPAKYEKHIRSLRSLMLKAASDLDFEEAAILRDQINAIQGAYLKIGHE